MKRITKIMLALLLAVSVMAMPLAAADAAGAQEEDETDETDDIAPGEQLAGVVGVQEAELEGDVSERTFGIKIANAQTDDAKADVVGDQLTDVEDRLEELETRSEELNAAYEAGEISQGEYRAEMASIAAEQRTAERLADGTAAAADGLDDEVLAERGIDAEAIQTLSDRAAELDGEEVSEIAQSIAGPQVGQAVDEDRGPGAPIETPHGDQGPANDADASDADEPEQNEADAPGTDEPEQNEADANTDESADANTDESDEEPDTDTSAGDTAAENR
ncbi:hypothetical protein [Natrialba sp. INN-245]|uniref:hypothetical protein n=1 Tax=Natrialba sp. INN-245 TaxID=2690967 RepID=UPI001313174A|nr:hypothetical protein [Natrialba sp. INN-245]MWV38568.1 hypothetical protein [Natrialba sp. INN-245]